MGSLFLRTICGVLITIFPFYTAKGSEADIVITPVVATSTTYDAEYMMLQKFKTPIRFTQQGVREFLKNTISDPLYIQEFLPHHLEHMFQFLQFGKENNQKIIYTIATIRLFSNKLKQVPYLSHTTANAMIKELPSLLENHFQTAPYSFAADLKNNLKRILYHNFLSKFSFFQKEPESFLDDLSAEMVATIEKTNYVDQVVNKEQLKHHLIRFIEVTISKMLWSPKEQTHVWRGVKETAELCNNLYVQGIISEDDLDDLYQSLITRFSDFLLLAGNAFELETIEEIRADLEENNLLLFTLNEQEECIESRSKRLKNTVDILEIKIRADQMDPFTQYTVKN